MGRNNILNFIESKEVFHDEPLTFIGWPHSILFYVPPQGRAESGTKPFEIEISSSRTMLRSGDAIGQQTR